MTLKCILCKSTSSLFFSDTNLSYYQCTHCNLIFLNPELHLTEAEEKDRYLIHKNDSNDEGYRNYLTPAADAIDAILENDKDANPDKFKVLDFGCGADSPIKSLLEPLHIQYFAYDPYFKNDMPVLKETYNAVIATEVIEHLRTPDQTLAQLKELITSNGHLIFMTQFYSPEIDFKNWHYRRDPTHVAFYSKKAMEFIKDHFEFKSVSFSHQRVAVFSR